MLDVSICPPLDVSICPCSFYNWRKIFEIQSRFILVEPEVCPVSISKSLNRVTVKRERHVNVGQDRKDKYGVDVKTDNILTFTSVDNSESVVESPVSPLVFFLPQDCNTSTRTCESSTNHTGMSNCYLPLLCIITDKVSVTRDT